MDEPTLNELAERRAKALAMGTPAALEKIAASGRLNARQRVDLLLDPGSFEEIGMLARSQHPALREKTPADGLVAGAGTIDGRPVYVMSEDASVVAGTRGRTAEGKSSRIRELALRHQRPLIVLMEAGAGRFQENNGAMAAGIGYRFRDHFLLSGKVPQVAAVMGACFGGPSFTAMQSDYVTIVEGTGFIGMSGPPVVKVGVGLDVTNEQVGGAQKSSVETGQVDFVAKSDADCLRNIREFLSYFPSNSLEWPPVKDPEAARVDTDEGKAALRKIVPDNQRRVYPMIEVIKGIVDGGRLFPYRERYGPNLIAGWARVGGRVVGVLANNPMYLAGAMDEKAGNKLCKFVNICDAFHIPVVFLTDCPGFLVGPDVEKQRMVSLAARCLNVVIGATVPKITIVVRKAIGLAYLAMGGKATGTDVIVAWPTARFDVMGPAAGVEIVYGREIANAEDPVAKREEIVKRVDDASKAYVAAEMAIIDDVIDPAETRAVIIDALRRAKSSAAPAFKHRIDP